ncbi:MAG: AbrB/MazE/SpoVT family DNA-binding domain-containing protein [bacterium]
MTATATITSKRQITIPAGIFYDTGLDIGDKVSVSTEGKAIKLEKTENILESLAGALATDLPQRFKGLSPDAIIKKAKQEYFSKNG